MQPTETTFERRRRPRRRVLFAGYFRPLNCRETVECTIRSLSASGAAVQIPASTPTAFELTIERDGAARMARTVWRNGDRHGVSFERPAVAAPVADGRRSIAELRGAVRFTTVE